jgi:dTDP-3-amino-2,3,6-trideoxy-4-keto-D-glucose/dTDP-3-amino-3,4,6-trideoxy-alpha-D-glucose/dTDP-2,6-dideoxy-D-kanosamine transaminase
LLSMAITPKTKAIMPVHLTGNPADMDEICRIAREHNVFVIEDAAQAVMASIKGKRVGSFGEIGCFSLHPLKNLNVGGDGGVITTQSREIYEKLNLYRNHGLINRDETEVFGYNSRLDTIHAVIADYFIPKLEEVTQKRRKNAEIYDNELKNLSDFVKIPLRRENFFQVFHTYVIMVERREELIKYLSENGIETKIHYPIPIHVQKPYQKLGFKKGDFPLSERQASSIISLPIHQFLTEEQIYYVITKIKEFYK